MKTDKFQTALKKYFDKYKTHPRYEFWIKDHLWKVGIPNSEVLDYIYNIVEYIHKNYLSSFKKNEIKILDLGCGMGEFAVFLSLSGYYVVGVDMDKEQLKIAKILKEENKAKVEFINTDATKLPFKDEEFDIIICFDVFEHVDDLQPICNEMWRILKNDGVIFLRFPNKLKGYEDHVGLPLLPLLPERIFQFVFRKIIKSRKYYQEGLYVYYRRFSEVYQVLTAANFHISQLPEHLMFPRLPRMYKRLIRNNVQYIPIISPYFHFLLTKKPVDSSLQNLDIRKIKLFEFIWWFFVLIISIASVFKNTISKKNRR
ncbi:class I SAM-dependent methyltransferase [Methanocaldococcus sp. 16A]